MQRAKDGIAHAEEHFEEKFRVKKYGERYILTSDTHSLDARGFVVSDDSPLEKGVETFHRILEESSFV